MQLSYKYLNVCNWCFFFCWFWLVDSERGQNRQCRRSANQVISVMATPRRIYPGRITVEQ